MNHQPPPMSAQIEAAIAALEANPNPTPVQVRELREVHLEMLGQLRDFALDVEESRRRNLGYRRIPVWSGASAAARLYHWLAIGRRRPIAGMGATVIALVARVAR